MQEPNFFNPSISLDALVFGNAPLRTLQRIAAASFTHAAHFMRLDLALLKQQWHAALPRLADSEPRLLSILAALLPFNLPDAPFAGQRMPLVTWLDTWELQPGAAKSLAAASAAALSAKDLYTAAVLPRADPSPRVLRKWRHLLPQPLTSLHRAWFKKVWRTRMPRRWLDTLYAVLNNSLPTSTKVLHRNQPYSCPVCHQGPDYIPHILFLCAAAQEGWTWAQQVLQAWIPAARLPGAPLDFRLWLCITLDFPHLQHPWKWLFWSIPVLRALWFSRNAQVFNGRRWSLPEAQNYCISQWLSTALLLSQHYPVAAFQPLIGLDLRTLTPHWHGPAA